MTILLHKPYLVKVTTKGGGGSKIPKILTTWFMDDPICELATIFPQTGRMFGHYSSLITRWFRFGIFRPFVAYFWRLNSPYDN